MKQNDSIQSNYKLKLEKSHDLRLSLRRNRKKGPKKKKIIVNYTKKKLQNT